MFIGTIPDGPPVIIACPIEEAHSNAWIKAKDVAWTGSEMEELAVAMDAPDNVKKGEGIYI